MSSHTTQHILEVGPATSNQNNQTKSDQVAGHGRYKACTRDAVSIQDSASKKQHARIARGLTLADLPVVIAIAWTGQPPAIVRTFLASVSQRQQDAQSSK